MDYMNQQGDTVYLKATPEVLHEHLKMGKTVRPLLLDKTTEEVHEFIEEQLKIREPFYTKAKYTLDVNLMDNYEKIKISVQKLRELLSI
jgi:shikimate kinase